MERMTYRDILRTYADNVRSGRADTDLSPLEARLTAMLVTTASNDGTAAVAYPPEPADRDAVVARMQARLWDANVAFLMAAVSGRTRDAFGTANERAVAIVRGV